MERTCAICSAVIPSARIAAALLANALTALSYAAPCRDVREERQLARSADHKSKRSRRLCVHTGTNQGHLPFHVILKLQYAVIPSRVAQRISPSLS